MLRWLLRSLGGSTWPLAGSQAESFFFCSRRSLELLARNVPDDRQDTKVQLLSTSATLSSPHEGWLCFSVAHGFPKARFFHAASIIAVRSRLPIKRLHERKNDGCTCAYSTVPQNGVKTETFSPQNNRATELNVNFLLIATVVRQ